MKSKINWVNAIFFSVSPIIAIAGCVWVGLTQTIHWQTWVLMAIYWNCGLISITAGYHRLFSHKTYQASWPVRLFFVLFGAATLQGSIIEWSTDHRDHHRYTDDNEKDPYSSRRGFWYSHMGWLYTLNNSKRKFDNVDDLQRDPLVMWQHKYYLTIAIGVSFGLPLFLGLTWGNGLAAFFLVGWLRVVLNHHSTFFINSLAHMWGKRPFSKFSSARDNWFLSLFTYGEGYHNFHHQFARDYRNGIKSYNFDPSKWLIFSLEKIKLASQLTRVPTKLITNKQIEREHEWALKLPHVSREYIDDLLKPMRQAIKQLNEELDNLSKEYRLLKQKKSSELNGKVEDYKLAVRDCKFRIKLAKAKIRLNMHSWSCLIKDFSKYPSVNCNSKIS